MTKAEFKRRWDSDDTGGGITYNEIADCARSWGLYSTPRTCPIDVVTYRVRLRALPTSNAQWNPDNG